MARISALRAASRADTAELAVRELRAALDVPGLKAVLLFVSPRYDPAVLGPALARAFPCPIAGCTTSGEIGPEGYRHGGLVALGLAGDDLDVHPFLIEPLSRCRERAAEVGARVHAALARLAPRRRAFGLLLADGLSLAEEALAATLYQSLGDVPIVGGSAGDDLAFRSTGVYWQGGFRSDAAVLAVVETSLRFAPVKLQHFQPTARKLVITGADPAARVVLEIDGFPAAEAYAEAIGSTVEQLEAGVVSAHPLMLRIGGDHYVRSVSRVNPDRSLSFFCAIEEGLVLSIGEARDPVAALDEGLRQATRGFTRPTVIGFDCVLRRLDLERRGLVEQAGAVLARHGVVGFSTYGEQVNGLHVNQTFTGLVLGE